MPDKWPSFITKDLGTSDEDDAEFMRRWEAYEREMKIIIASGVLHQDEDGWWVVTATGELIGPDLDDDRPRTAEEMAQGKSFAEACPDLAAAIRRERERKACEGLKRQNAPLGEAGGALSELADEGD
jgi:hypothetical protein